MSISRRLTLAAASFGVAVLLAQPACADDSEAFFARGRTLRMDGKCADAILAFRKALELRPDGIGSLRNIAECEEELGRLASARASFWALRTAALGTKEPKYARWSEEAEAAYRRLDPQVPRLTVRLAGRGADRARVTLDGRALHPDLLDTELERDPGLHVVEAYHGGAVPIRAERTLAAGAREVVTLVIPGDAGAAGSSSALRTAGYVTVGAGGGAFGVAAAIAAAVRTSALSTLESDCPIQTTAGRACTPGKLAEAMSAQGRGNVANTLMDVFAVLGGVCVAGGIPLIVIRSSPSAPRDGAADGGAGVVLAPLAWGAQVQLRGRF